MSTSSIRIIDSPIGPLTVAATERGIFKVDFGAKQSLVDGTDMQRTAATAVVDQAERELAEYFAGQRRKFDVPIDLPQMSPFRTKAMAAMSKIGYGQTVTYAQLATAAGRENAARAAGGACAKNPVPVFVPCHRVLPSSGGIGNYGGGAKAKALLLNLERDLG